MSVVLASAFVAVRADPMFVLAVVFSAMERVAVLVAKLGASLTFVTVIVTGMLSLPP